MTWKVSEFFSRSISSRLSRRPSALKTTVLTWRMLVSMPKPSTTICSNGITSEKKSVEGSRRTCSVSLKNTARNPRNRSDMSAFRQFARLGLMLVGELDENVLEARLKGANLPHGNAVSPELLAQIVQVKAVFDERVNGLSKNSSAANPGNLPRQSQSARHFWRGDFDPLSAVRLDIGQLAQRVGRAVGDELTEVDVSDVTAAFRLIHVMGGDKK